MKVSRTQMVALFFAMVWGWTVFSSTEELSATEMVKRSYYKMRGKTNHMTMSMKVIRPRWSRETTMKVWSNGNTYSLSVVLTPTKDKGVAFLKVGNEAWNWLPSIDRSVKISASQMSQSWMGSDFTNEDLLREASIVYDYTHTMNAEVALNGTACYVVDLLPKEGAPVVWGKIKIWIDKATFNQMQLEYFDEEGELVNRLSMSGVKKIGGKIIPTILTMIPVEKDGHSTVLQIIDANFGVNLEESFFSMQNMKRVR